MTLHPSAPSASGPVAYLVSAYPAPSHTFIRREVEALRARGIAIETFSIRRPPAGARWAPADRAALDSTTYLLPASPADLLRSHARALFGQTQRYLGTLRLALRHRPPGLRAWSWALFHFAEAILLAGKLEQRGIRHLHNHFANASANVGLLASHFLQLPWSLTLHGSADWSYPSGYLLPAKIEAACFVACVSRYGLSQACRVTAPSLWDKFFIARCGVDLSVFPVARPAAAPAPLRILAVGRLSPEKGHAGLLHAFDALRRGGVDARLTIIGDGPLRGELARLVAALGLDGHCELLGQRAEGEVLEALAGADLFVMSSFMEGLPVVLMEAMGMGVPVVAPCVAGIPELVRHDVTGLLYTVGDWDDLARQMRRACGDVGLRRTLADQGLRLVTEEYEIGRAVAPLARRFAAAEQATGVPGSGGDRR